MNKKKTAYQVADEQGDRQDLRESVCEHVRRCVCVKDAAKTTIAR